MKAAVLQLSSQDDVAANLATVRRLVAEAAKAGAELVTLPENFAFFGDEQTKRAIAETVIVDAGAGAGVRETDGSRERGPIVSALAEAARANGVFLVAGGMPERSPDPERPFNSSLLIDPQGAVQAVYRKIHLFDVDLGGGTRIEESRATRAGEAAVVSEVAGTTLGMTVCYDLRFPELYRLLGTKGARVVTVPAAFTLTTGKDHWAVLLRARAIENQVFVLAPAQHGKHPRGRQTYGKSMIVDPWGDVLAQCGEGEGFAVASLDFAYQDRVRASLPCLAHRVVG